MRTSIRQLRQSLKDVFEIVGSGEDVIVYSHKIPIARITKVSKERQFEDVGFGMWVDYQETKNVDAFARRLRKGRKHDI